MSKSKSRLVAAKTACDYCDHTTVHGFAYWTNSGMNLYDIV